MEIRNSSVSYKVNGKCIGMEDTLHRATSRKIHVWVAIESAEFVAKGSDTIVLTRGKRETETGRSADKIQVTEQSTETERERGREGERASFRWQRRREAESRTISRTFKDGIYDRDSFR